MANTIASRYTQKFIRICICYRTDVHAFRLLYNSIDLAFRITLNFQRNP